MADMEKENEEAREKAAAEAEAEEEIAEETEAAPEEEAPEEEASGEEISEEEVSGGSEDEDLQEDAEGEEAEETSEEPKKKERKLNWAKNGKDKPVKESKEDILTAQLAEEKDKYARLIAEFDNFRKRNEKEKDQMYDFGAKAVAEKILPVIDNFERGLAALSDEEKEGAFAQGMSKTYKQFMEILDGIGVKPIEAVGEQFDPELHNAVMHVDDEEAGENTVVEEFQKGYTYKDKLLRPSMVKVAN